MAPQCDLVWLLRVSQLLRPYLLPQSLRQVHDVLSAAESVPPISDSEVQSCPWVGLTHGLGWVGLGWVGSGWVEVFQFLVGWVGSIIAKGLC